MKRLTTNNLELRKCLYCEEQNECYSKGWCSAVRKAIIELARYEKTGLIPDQIQELKERDTEKSVYHYHEEEKFRAYCPTCKRYLGIDFKEGYRGTKNTFCPGCGQRVKWED